MAAPTAAPLTAAVAAGTSTTPADQAADAEVGQGQGQCRRNSRSIPSLTLTIRLFLNQPLPPPPPPRTHALPPPRYPVGMLLSDTLPPGSAALGQESRAVAEHDDLPTLIERVLNNVAAMANIGFNNPWLGTLSALGTIVKEKTTRGGKKTIATINKGAQTVVPSGLDPVEFNTSLLTLPASMQTGTIMLASGIALLSSSSSWRTKEGQSARAFRAVIRGETTSLRDTPYDDPFLTLALFYPADDTVVSGHKYFTAGQFMYKGGEGQGPSLSNVVLFANKSFVTENMKPLDTDALMSMLNTDESGLRNALNQSNTDFKEFIETAILTDDCVRILDVNPTDLKGVPLFTAPPTAPSTAPSIGQSLVPHGGAGGAGDGDGGSTGEGGGRGRGGGGGRSRGRSASGDPPKKKQRGRGTPSPSLGWFDNLLVDEDINTSGVDSRGSGGGGGGGNSSGHQNARARANSTDGSAAPTNGGGSGGGGGGALTDPLVTQLLQSQQQQTAAAEQRATAAQQQVTSAQQQLYAQLQSTNELLQQQLQQQAAAAQQQNTQLLQAGAQSQQMIAGVSMMHTLMQNSHQQFNPTALSTGLLTMMQGGPPPSAAASQSAFAPVSLPGAPPMAGQPPQQPPQLPPPPAPQPPHQLFQQQLVVHGPPSVAGAGAPNADIATMPFGQLTAEIGNANSALTSLRPGHAAAPAIQARLEQLTTQLHNKVNAGDYS